MKIGIISDTHDQIKRIQKAVDIFNKQKIDLLIHLGDLVSPFTLQYYKKINCPIKFLFGNNTGDIALHLEYAKKFGLEDYEFKTFYALNLDGKKVAAYHGDNPEITEALIKCGSYDCVFSGHFHFAKLEKIGGTISCNPGTLVDKHKSGMKPPSVAVYSTSDHKARIVYLEENS